MTWSNRFRLLGGMLFVLVIVAAATFVLSQREGQAASTSASINALSYNVGSDYPGTVTAEDVKVGDTVKRGQPLIQIQSASLANAMKQMHSVPVSAAYKVGTTGMLTLVATESGVVSDVTASVGGFVGAGNPLATIDRSNSLYVSAKFRVNPYDFARITKNAAVDIVLPDHERLKGIVDQISVQTVGGQANAEIVVKSTELKQGADAGLIASGTPVTAILHLRDDGPFAGFKDSVLSLFERIGL